MFLLQEQFMNVSHHIYVHSMSPTVIFAATSINAACCKKVKKRGFLCMTIIYGLSLRPQLSAWCKSIRYDSGIPLSRSL